MRLATFNILHGRSLSDGAVDLDRFAAAVRGLDADVLALQEVDRDQPRSHGADLTTVAAAAMGAAEHRFAATLHGLPGLWTAASGDAQPRAAGYGIALLSRHPVRDWRIVSLPRLRRRVPLRWHGRVLPSLVRDEPRAALVGVVDAPEGSLTVVATHLSVIPAWGPRQLRQLVEETRTLPRPFVLMGDLNIAGARPARLSGLRPLVTAPTFPVGAPVRQIDHVLADGPVRPLRAGSAVDTGVSDHRALVVDVVLG